MSWLKCSINAFDERVPVTRSLTVTAASMDDVIAVLGALRDPLRTRAIEEASHKLSAQDLPGPRASRSANSEDTVDGTGLRLTLEIHGALPRADGASQWLVEATCVRRSASVAVEHVVWARAADATAALRLATTEIAAGLDLREGIRHLQDGLRVASMNVNGRFAVLMVRGNATPS